MRIFLATTGALAFFAALASAAPFPQIDRNEDGLISKREFIRNYGPELDVFHFRSVDKNDDGSIDRREFFDARNGVLGLLRE